jgi:deazaflavin-dependent oxidoreductase (nitroreductase family)
MANALTPVAIWLGSLSWLPRFLRQITAIDKFLQRISRGRFSLVGLAGLPSMTLTIVGRKSGIPRTTPVVCVPYGLGNLVAGSNFGGPKEPVWVLNIRAAQQAGDPVGVRMGRVEYRSVPRELIGSERDQAWVAMLQVWPNYAKYAERTDRTIPVFLLEPV